MGENRAWLRWGVEKHRQSRVRAVKGRAAKGQDGKWARSFVLRTYVVGRMG